MDLPGFFGLPNLQEMIGTKKEYHSDHVPRLCLPHFGYILDIELAEKGDVLALLWSMTEFVPFIFNRCVRAEIVGDVVLIQNFPQKLKPRPLLTN